ncbi:DUF4031 domain-containing protein [Kytococcus sp. Marseille-QA3725]
MALWIDRPAWPAHDTLFSHLVSDGGLEATGTASWVVAAREVTEAVAAVGLHHGWLDGDHADVPASSFEELLDTGAQLRTAREITSMLGATGQRLRKRKGEKCVGRTVLDEDRRVDVVRSPHAPDARTLVGRQAVVVDAAGDLLLAEGPDGWGLPGLADRPERATPAGQTGDAGRPVGYVDTATRQWADGGVSVGHEHRSLYLLQVGRRSTVGASGVLGSASEWRWADRTAAEALTGGAPWWPLVACGLERGW